MSSVAKDQTKRRATLLGRVPSGRSVFAVSASKDGFRWVAWRSAQDVPAIYPRTFPEWESAILERRGPALAGVEGSEAEAVAAALAAMPEALQIGSSYAAPRYLEWPRWREALLRDSREIAQRIEADAHLTGIVLQAMRATRKPGATELAMIVQDAYNERTGSRHNLFALPSFRLAIRRLRGESFDDGEAEPCAVVSLAEWRARRVGAR